MARRTKKTTASRTSKAADPDTTSPGSDGTDETLPAAKVEDAVVLSETSVDGETVTPKETADASTEETVAEAAGDGTRGDDAVLGADTAPDSTDDTSPGAASSSADDDTVLETPERVGEDTESATIDPDPTLSAGDDTLEARPVEDMPGDATTDAEDTAEDRNQGAMIAPPPPQIVEGRKSGFVPLVLGGVIAGIIGYAAATFLPGDPAGVEADRIAALEADLAALQGTIPSDGPDLTALEATQADLSDRLAALEAQVNALPDGAGGATDTPAAGASTAGLDDASAPDGTRADLSDVQARLDGLSADLAALDVATLRQRVDGLAGTVESISLTPIVARIERIETTVADLQARAEAGAEDAEAVARAAARDQLALAMESGQPYAEPLAQLPDAPDALQASAETGVPTTSALMADFPPLAREALRAARAAEPGEGGLGSLAGRFLNARSLEPREGDDPDAVLSRAEAAMRAGDVQAALAEVQALPDVARAPLADWIARAEERAAAKAALDDYLQDG